MAAKTERRFTRDLMFEAFNKRRRRGESVKLSPSCHPFDSLVSFSSLKSGTSRIKLRSREIRTSTVFTGKHVADLTDLGSAGEERISRELFFAAGTKERAYRGGMMRLIMLVPAPRACCKLLTVVSKQRQQDVEQRKRI